MMLAIAPQKRSDYASASFFAEDLNCLVRWKDGREARGGSGGWKVWHFLLFICFVLALKCRFYLGAFNVIQQKKAMDFFKLPDVDH
jgi:hypothetical protein